ncbi:MAG: ABC transporter ATP-binding protein, partial [Caulobacterales bacterium]|nr:ABC transporter ATP-binding protein [Caulobacterales bacterium]
LDEPFSALDPATREELQTDFTAIHRELGLTTVMVSHDMAEALTMADEVVVMRAGKIVQHGPPRALADTPADDSVARLVDTPRRQAAALRAALAESVP